MNQGETGCPASYKTLIDHLQEKHHVLIKELLPEEKQEEALDALDATFDYIKGIAKGVCLLGELTPTSLDAIQGCGELLSTRILATRLASTGIPTKWVDSREIIKTYTGLRYPGLRISWPAFHRIMVWIRAISSS